MTDLVSAYLVQARGDMAVFELLLAYDRQVVAECHPLHYLQMATEKLSKAALMSLGVEGFDRFSHVAFWLLPYQLKRRDVARSLGWTNFQAYRQFLRRAMPLFRAIDELNPVVGPQITGSAPAESPNVEYPWPGRAPDGSDRWHIPARHDFRLLTQLQESRQGASVLHFIYLLIDRFEAVFR